MTTNKETPRQQGPVMCPEVKVHCAAKESVFMTSLIPGSRVSSQKKKNPQAI